MRGFEAWWGGIARMRYGGWMQVAGKPRKGDGRRGDGEQGLRLGKVRLANRTPWLLLNGHEAGSVLLL